MNSKTFSIHCDEQLWFVKLGGLLQGKRTVHQYYSFMRYFSYFLDICKSASYMAQNN